MVACGCLDSIHYTDGETERDKMEKVVLHRLKGNGMIFELTWHGPVGDVYYRVEADTWEDAEQEVCRALNEDDERWLCVHEIQPLWSEAD
jgi:hypothetical protein